MKENKTFFWGGEYSPQAFFIGTDKEPPIPSEGLACHFFLSKKGGWCIDLTGDKPHRFFQEKTGGADKDMPRWVNPMIPNFKSPGVISQKYSMSNRGGCGFLYTVAQNGILPETSKAEWLNKNTGRYWGDCWWDYWWERKKGGEHKKGEYKEMRVYRPGGRRIPIDVGSNYAIDMDWEEILFSRPMGRESTTLYVHKMDFCDIQQLQLSNPLYIMEIPWHIWNHEYKKYVSCSFDATRNSNDAWKVTKIENGIFYAEKISKE